MAPPYLTHAGCTFQKAISSSFDSALCLQNNTFKALRAFHQSVSQALIFVAVGTNSAPRNRVAVGRTASFTLTVCLAVASSPERDSPFQKYLGTRNTGQKLSLCCDATKSFVAECRCCHVLLTTRRNGHQAQADEQLQCWTPAAQCVHNKKYFESI